MGSGNDSILDMYLYETNTLLEQLDGILLAAEQADTFSQDSVNEIFRIMHTIKGSSAMMEFPSLMTVAHRIEDLFFIIRDKTMEAVPEALRPELFDMIFQAVDFFRGEIEKVENGEPLSVSIDSIVDKINSLIDKIQGTAAAPWNRASKLRAENSASRSSTRSPQRRFRLSRGRSAPVPRHRTRPFSTWTSSRPKRRTSSPTSPSRPNRQGITYVNGFIFSLMLSEEAKPSARASRPQAQNKF